MKGVDVFMRKVKAEHLKKHYKGVRITGWKIDIMNQNGGVQKCIDTLLDSRGVHHFDQFLILSLIRAITEGSEKKIQSVLTSAKYSLEHSQLLSPELKKQIEDYISMLDQRNDEPIAK